MTPSSKLLDILAQSSDASADQTLGAGLPLVSGDLQRRMIDILLSRTDEDRLVPILDVFDRLEPQSQDKIVAAHARLFGALRVGVRASEIQTRLNTLTIIRRSRNPRLAYLAALGVYDGSHQIRAEAGHALRELTELHCVNHAETTAALRDASDGDLGLSTPIAHALRLLRDERQHLIDAIRDALSNYESHHRPEVLEAAMFLAEELEDSLFKDDMLKRGKLTQAMLDVYSNSPSPRLAPFTYIAIKYPELRRRIVTVLGNLRSAEFFSEFIRYHWLVSDPAIRRHLQGIRSLTWLSDGFDAVFSMPSAIAAATPGWLVALGLPSDEKIRLLLNLLMVDNPDANVAAAWALTKLPTPGAFRALQGAEEHDEPRVRTIARSEIAHRRRTEKLRVTEHRRNRPADWCELLDRAGIAEDFEELWMHFDRMPADLAARSGHHAFKFIPAFQMQMQVKLIAPQPADRTRALKLLGELHVVDRFCKEVFALANDPAAEVRAAATRVLPTLGDPTSRRIIERSLSDSAPLVQATAIEAIDRLALPRRAELFMPKTTSDDAEVRSAAVLALLKLQVPKAATALVAMLKDSRANHRCHALWIIERLRLTALTSKVAELAETSTDTKIARVAQQVLRRLSKSQKTRPAPQAAPQAAPAVEVA